MSGARTTAPPRRNGLFNKPSWAAMKTAEKNESDSDFYQHSENLFEGILAQERAEREQATERKIRRSRERDHKSKRRRISEEPQHAKEVTPVEDTKESPGLVAIESRRVTRSTPTKIKHFSKSLDEFSKSPQTSKGSVIVLEDEALVARDSSRTPEAQSKLSAKLQAQAQSSDIDSDEDDYIRELKRKAREKEQLKKTGILGTLVTVPGSVTIPEPQCSPTVPLVPSKDQDKCAEPGQASRLADDPIVSIFINPAIPNTKPLLVNRRSRQNLRPALQAWLKRQEALDEAIRRKVFFTWRGTRLYNSTTCTHILNRLKDEIASSSLSIFTEMDDSAHLRVEVEAVTEEILEERRRAKDLQALRTRDDTFLDDDPENDDSVGRAPIEQSFQISLRGKNLESLDIKVKKSTMVQKVMKIFKSQRNVAPHKTCWLLFDGERLEPDQTFGDTEVEMNDVVEVHIR